MKMILILANFLSGLHGIPWGSCQEVRRREEKISMKYEQLTLIWPNKYLKNIWAGLVNKNQDQLTLLSFWVPAKHSQFHCFFLWKEKGREIINTEHKGNHRRIQVWLRKDEHFCQNLVQNIWSIGQRICLLVPPRCILSWEHWEEINRFEIECDG